MKVINQAKALMTRLAGPAQVVVKTWNPPSVPPNYPWNYWQMDLPEVSLKKSSIVEACVGAISQTAAMIPVRHVEWLASGERVPVTTSALHRVMNNPNSYQTTNHFLENLLRSMLFEGNGYAMAFRNSRFEVDSLHLLNPHSVTPHVAEDDPNDWWYSVGGNPMLPVAEQELATFVPSRNIPSRSRPIHPSPLDWGDPIDSRLSPQPGIHGHPKPGGQFLPKHVQAVRRVVHGHGVDAGTGFRAAGVVERAIVRTERGWNAHPDKRVEVFNPSASTRLTRPSLKVRN